jgi:hypothetical protein
MRWDIMSCRFFFLLFTSPPTINIPPATDCPSGSHCAPVEIIVLSWPLAPEYPSPPSLGYLWVLLSRIPSAKYYPRTSPRWHPRSSRRPVVYIPTEVNSHVPLFPKLSFCQHHHHHHNGYRYSVTSCGQHLPTARIQASPIHSGHETTVQRTKVAHCQPIHLVIR